MISRYSHQFGTDNWKYDHPKFGRFTHPKEYILTFDDPNYEFLSSFNPWNSKEVTHIGVKRK